MEIDLSKLQPLLKRRDELVAYNYIPDGANKIHSDEGAAQYGFKGALVPGIALYAYCTQAAVRQFGVDWLNSGYIGARFSKPIYHDERIAIESGPLEVERSSAPLLDIQLFKPDGTLSTRATASMESRAVIDGPANVASFAAAVAPEHDARLPPRLNSFQIGQTLGTIEFTAPAGADADVFARNMVDSLECYRGPMARVHPAVILANANQVLMRNIALGPWVHTASEMQHHAPVKPGQLLSLRSRVKDLQEKRGNEIITVDILVHDAQLQTIATIRHSAIIHLAKI